MTKNDKIKPIKNATKINKTLKNSIIFAIVFTLFFFADYFLKYLIFNKIEENYTVIGFRSVKHGSTTFLDFLNLKIPMYANIIISSAVGLIIIIFIILSKSKWAVVGLSIILAGTVGNTADNVFFGYVRDILYTPWFDRGTFNLADMWIIIGMPFTLIPTIYNLYKS